MNEGWTKVSIGATPDMVKGLEAFKTSAQAAIDVVNTIVSMAKTVADFILKVYVDLSDLEAEAMKAAIQAMRTILNDLLSDAGMYLLFVPMRVVDPTAWTGDPKFFYLGNRDSIGFPWLQTVPGPDVIDKPSGGSGGNYGFYSQVVASLQDEDDIMKPEFGDNAYVASVVFYAGADPANLSNLIILAKKLMRLFELPGPDLVPTDILPTPRGLTATVVPVPLSGDSMMDQYTSGKGNFSTQPYAVRLDWLRDEKDWILKAYGNVQFEIKKLYIYRWKDGDFTPEQIRGGAAKFNDDWESDNDKDVKRKELDYEGLASFFIDPKITPGNAYWYGVAYGINQVDEDGNVTQSMPPQDIASVRIDVPVDIKIAPRHGVPPDWFAAKLSGVIPGFGRLIAKINAWLDTLEAGIITGKDELQKFIDFLEAEIQRYTDWIAEIAYTIQELIDALTWPSVYAGIWTLPPGKGGNNYFLSQLGKGLFNQEDSSRPPFDRGNEVTCGFIMYMGSETPGAIEKFISTIDMLFGAFVENRQNALQDAINSLGGLKDRLDRDICLTQALIEKTCETVPEAPTSMDATLEPANESPQCSDAGLNSVQKIKFVDDTDALAS